MNLVPMRTGGKGAHKITTFRDTETGTMFRRCGICKETFPLESFAPGHTVDKNFGRAYRCGPCHRVRTYHQAFYLRKFGITKAEYDAMLAAQGGRCAICNLPSSKRLAVDHDHATGRIRGLLCYLCNTMLGNAKDSPSRLEAAAAYLRGHHAQSGTMAQERPKKPS